MFKKHHLDHNYLKTLEMVKKLIVKVIDVSSGQTICGHCVFV